MSERVTTDIDIYSDEMLESPYVEFARLRSRGAALWLSRYEMWAFPRYAEVRSALVDWKTFSSGSGVGIDPTFNDVRRGTVISSDPPHHTKLRSVFSERLSAGLMREIQVDIDTRADTLVRDLVSRLEFDAVLDLAEIFPISLVADLVGLPMVERDRLLERGRASFNAFGPRNQRGIESAAVFEDTKAYIARLGGRDGLSSGSFGAYLYDAADLGHLGPDDVIPLMFSYLFPSLDTTVAALGSAVWLLASHPDQWQFLKNDPSLVPATFEEVLRLETPIQFLSRRLSADHDADGEHMAPGDRVILMYGSANRDERRYAAPARFDIHRRPSDHLAFGAGIHNCVGARLARGQAHAILKALVRHVGRLHAGPATRRLNNTVRSLASLPVRVEHG